MVINYIAACTIIRVDKIKCNGIFKYHIFNRFRIACARRYRLIGGKVKRVGISDISTGVKNITLARFKFLLKEKRDD